MSSATVEERFQVTDVAKRSKFACYLGDFACLAGHTLYPIADYFAVSGSLWPIYSLRAFWIVVFGSHILSLRRKSQASRWDGLFTYNAGCLSIVSVTLATHRPSSDYIVVLSVAMICTATCVPLTTRQLAGGWIFSFGLYNILAACLGLVESASRIATHDAFLLITAAIAHMIHFLGNKLRFEDFRKSEELAHTTESLRSVLAQQDKTLLDLGEAVQKLKQLDLLKNESFANLSHEFRTPISFVKNTVQAALSYPSLDEGLRKLMTIAERYCKQSLGMINELLDLTKLDNTDEPVKRNCFDISHMVRELTEHSVMRAERRRISISFGAGAPKAVTVLANHNLVERACTNLISNAIKYTDDGGRIEVDLFVRPGQVHVVVSDTGIGIKQEDHDRVFGRFVQIKTGGRQERGGVGIGLSLVKSVAKSHGGDTTIASDGVPGKGSKIGFWIPLPSEEELASVDAFTPRAEQRDNGALAEWEEAERDRDAYRYQKIEDATEMRVLSRDVAHPDALKILLVEDNPDIARAMESFLAAEYNLRQARDGAEGLAVMEIFRPDLVITDVTMPKMDGEEMIRAMRNHSYGGTIPIVVLTAKGLEMDRDRLTKAGADAFLLKGCDIDELKNIMRTQLKRQVTSKKMVDDERMLAFRAASVGIAHEIKNPLNLLSNYNDQIRRYLDKVMANPGLAPSIEELVAKTLKALDGSDSNCERAKNCCETLRDISKGKDHEMPLSLGSINDVAAKAVASTDTKHDMVTDLRASKSIMMNAQKLEQVIVNLSVNAHQACDETYTKPIEIRTRDTDDGKYVELTVKDFGPGMSEALKERIFLPFFTTKATGTGIGLHVCRHILASHGGTLTVRSAEGAGSVFIVRIPVAGT